MVALNENAVTLLARVTGIDAKTVAATALYTVPAGKYFVLDHIVRRTSAFTAGSKTTQAIASFGCNDPIYDDYLDSVEYAVTMDSSFHRDSVEDTEVPVYGPGSVFKISIETGSDADTETWDIDVFGYLI